MNVLICKSKEYEIYKLKTEVIKSSLWNFINTFENNLIKKSKPISFLIKDNKIVADESNNWNNFSRKFVFSHEISSSEKEHQEEHEKRNDNLFVNSKTHFTCIKLSFLVKLNRKHLLFWSFILHFLWQLLLIRTKFNLLTQK